MAALTKADVRTATRQALDDPNAKLWTDANLDVLTQLVVDHITSTLLDVFPWLTSVTASPTLVSGAVDVTLLDERFVRVQKLLVSTNLYQPKTYEEAYSQRTYTVTGGLVTTSDAASGTATLTYGYLPQPYTELAEDDVLPEFLQGHELAVIYVTAVWAFTKGSREDAAAIAALADSAVDALIRATARRSPATPVSDLPGLRQQLIAAPPAAGDAAGS